MGLWGCFVLLEGYMNLDCENLFSSNAWSGRWFEGEIANFGLRKSWIKMVAAPYRIDRRPCSVYPYLYWPSRWTDSGPFGPGQFSPGRRLLMFSGYFRASRGTEYSLGYFGIGWGGHFPETGVKQVCGIVQIPNFVVTWLMPAFGFSGEIVSLGFRPEFASSQRRLSHLTYRSRSTGCDRRSVCNVAVGYSLCPAGLVCFRSCNWFEL
jgi:hypothetical protein